MTSSSQPRPSSVREYVEREVLKTQYVRTVETAAVMTIWANKITTLTFVLQYFSATTKAQSTPGIQNKKRLNIESGWKAFNMRVCSQRFVCRPLMEE